MNLALAILWTFALMVDIVSCVMGNEPTWTLVFCPLICLIVGYWEGYFNNK